MHLVSGMVFEHTFCRTCLRCCKNTEMILLRCDLERIEGLGYRRNDFAELRDSFIRLRNVDGRCIFLDESSGGCRIYDARPLGCRIYPLIYDEDTGIRFDSECPLASYWMLNCSELVRGINELMYFLRRLEVEYGYKVDWSLFYSSKKRLLRSCVNSEPQTG